MTAEMWITLLILAVAIFLFITEWIRLDVVALCVMAALLLTGILTTNEALSGFSSTATISIAALFIVGGAVFQTGLAAMIAQRILSVAGGSERRLLIVLVISIATMSAFMSSTGVVALMLPAVVSLAGSMKINTSRLMIPMAFSALIGGSLTLIGTPPNLLVSEALVKAGEAPLDFFAFTPLGLLLVATVLIYLLVAGRWVLPDRIPPQTVQQAITPGELFALYRLPDNVFHLRIQDQSQLIGKTIQESQLRHDFDVNIMSLTRLTNGSRSKMLAALPVNSRPHPDTFHAPRPDTVLQKDDILLVQGNADDIGRAAGFWKLAIMANEPVQQGEVITNEVGIAEVLLRPRSTLIGKSLTDLRFGSTYKLTVLDVRRPGSDEPINLKETPLKFGDVLLVQGEWKDIFALKRLRQDFVVMGEREAIQLGAFTHPEKAVVALGIMIAMVALIALNIMSLVLASLLAAIALVITGCLTMDDGYNTIDWKSLVLIAGMLPMSIALEKVGLAQLVADIVIGSLGQIGPLPAMAGIFLMTAFFTQVLSNTATAVLIAPIAIATAAGLGVHPQAFVMSVAFAASAAFATPIASPVNTLVMSAGHYKFSDYVRAGLPMVLIAALVSMLVLPILYPF